MYIYISKNIRNRCKNCQLNWKDDATLQQHNTGNPWKFSHRVRSYIWVGVHTLACCISMNDPHKFELWLNFLFTKINKYKLYVWVYNRTKSANATEKKQNSVKKNNNKTCTFFFKNEVLRSVVLKKLFAFDFCKAG